MRVWATRDAELRGVEVGDPEQGVLLRLESWVPVLLTERRHRPEVPQDDVEAAVASLDDGEALTGADVLAGEFASHAGQFVAQLVELALHGLERVGVRLRHLRAESGTAVLDIAAERDDLALQLGLDAGNLGHRVRALVGLLARRFQILDISGLDRRDARPAAARSASARNVDVLVEGKREEIARRWIPLVLLSRF